MNEMIQLTAYHAYHRKIEIGDEFYLFLLFSGILSLLELSDKADLSQGGCSIDPHTVLTEYTVFLSRTFKRV